jgi:hypothetical protein
MIANHKLQRVSVAFLVAVVAILTTVVVTNATQTITTPNATTITYNLAAGAVSAAIAPATNRAVHVMGVQTAVGNRGVGFVELLVTNVAPLFVEWVGLESTAGAAITQGFSAVAGTHIVYIDFAHTVDVEVNTASTIRIHNANAAAQTGSLTLIW